MTDQKDIDNKYSVGTHIKNIAFFGDAHVPETDQAYKDAFEIAKELASSGFTIVNGGGPGIMNASTQGAEAVGGKTLSVTFSPTDAPGFEGRYIKNVTDKEVRTTNYIDRMFGLLENGDLFIIFKGGSGTISEWGTAWVLSKLYYGHHKPFILFGAHWIPIIDVVRENMNVDKEELATFEIVIKPEDVLPTIKKFDRRIAEYDHSKDCVHCVDKAFTV